MNEKDPQEEQEEEGIPANLSHLIDKLARQFRRNQALGDFNQPTASRGGFKNRGVGVTRKNKKQTKVKRLLAQASRKQNRHKKKKRRKK
jgi:hypothetical protein